jgi:hypothetical protein
MAFLILQRTHVATTSQNYLPSHYSLINLLQNDFHPLFSLIHLSSIQLRFYLLEDYGQKYCTTRVSLISEYCMMECDFKNGHQKDAF